MAYYDELKGRNIIAACQRLLRAGILELRMSDGRMTPKFKVTWDTPWIHTKSSYRSNCYIWKDIIFENIVMGVLPPALRFVPSGCQGCYKVVVRPQTLKQLMALEQLEKRLDHDSKCGIEIRDSVFGNYGGYFYNRGIHEGLMCYTKVRDAVDVDPELGPDIPVILKRGCTEMEHNIGPSNAWEITDSQTALEELINQIIVTDVPNIGQADHAKDYVRQTWIESAYKWGDKTVFEYIDGPLFPDYVTYQHFLEQPEDGENPGPLQANNGDQAEPPL